MWKTSIMKITKRKIEKDSRKWKNHLCSWIGRINIIKMELILLNVKCIVYPKQFTDSMQLPPKFQWYSSQKNSKINMEAQNTKKPKQSWARRLILEALQYFISKHTTRAKVVIKWYSTCLGSVKVKPWVQTHHNTPPPPRKNPTN
jgi:hypothetical protein